MSPILPIVARQPRLAAASRESHLALRRVERQQQLIEHLYAVAERRTLAELATYFGVSRRTIARDVERLRLSGVPIRVTAGPAGGVDLTHHARLDPIHFDLPEIAALMSSLAVLGPTATDSATSAMRKLTATLE